MQGKSRLIESFFARDSILSSDLIYISPTTDSASTFSEAATGFNPCELRVIEIRHKKHQINHFPD